MKTFRRKTTKSPFLHFQNCYPNNKHNVEVEELHKIYCCEWAMMFGEEQTTINAQTKHNNRAMTT